jgi:hypothetical protein
MAEELPQLKNTQPILQAQRISSKAEGFEQFGQTLGKIASQSADKAIQIENNQSNAGLLLTANQAQTLKTSAQMEMLKHPDQAEKIAASTKENINKLNENAFVNNKDRRKLQYMTATEANEISLKAAQISFQQNKKNLSNMYWEQYPLSMKSIQDAIQTGDFKKVEVLEESFHQATKNALQIGAITGPQYARIIQSNHQLYSRAQELLGHAKNPDGISAPQFHASMASPFDTSSHQNATYPVDGHTQWMADHYNSDRTMQGQMSALYHNEPINYGIVAGASQHQYDEFVMENNGKTIVNSKINAGIPFSQIENEIKALEANPGLLSPTQKGQVNYWKAFTSDFKSGDGYLRLMSQTSLGGVYTQEYNEAQTAVNINLDLAQKTADQQNIQKYSQELRYNYNDYIGKMKSLGEAQHIDPNFVNPIDIGTRNTVQAAFIKDAPVGDALKKIDYVYPQYRAYIAAGLTKPEQVMSTFIVGATSGKADAGFRAELISANQGHDYAALLKTGPNQSKDNNIWQDISSNSQVSTLNQYFGKLPGGNDIQNGFRKAAINYVLYRASKQGDINLNGRSQYIQDFIDNTTKGFNIVSGNRYMFNAADLNLRKVDMDYLSDYVLSEAYKKIHVGRDEANFQAYIDANPLHATNTPDGRIVVIDKEGNAAVGVDGHEAFDRPFTSNMVDYAHANAKATVDYLHPYVGITESIKHDAMLHPNSAFATDRKDIIRSGKKFQKSLLKTITFGKFGNESTEINK